MERIGRTPVVILLHTVELQLSRIATEREDAERRLADLYNLGASAWQTDAVNDRINDLCREADFWYARQDELDDREFSTKVSA